MNGWVRDVLYGRHMSELHAQQLSTLSALILFSVYLTLILRFWKIQSAAQAVAIGTAWVVLTVLFEFSFFHYVGHRPWNELMAQYDVLHGRLWVLVLIWLGAAPTVAYRFTES